jgi:hypothetical protein
MLKILSFGAGIIETEGLEHWPILEISHMHVLHPTLQAQISLISKAQLEF